MKSWKQPSLYLRKKLMMEIRLQEVFEGALGAGFVFDDQGFHMRLGQEAL